MGSKKILVVSHERSGTHFLINSIALNFGYQERQIDLDLTQGFSCARPVQAAAWLARCRGRVFSNVFKAHHARPLLLPLLEPLRDEFHIFYIYRDGRDVMTSFWRYLNHLQPGWGPQTRTPGEFMRARPFGGILQYQNGPGDSMLSRWISHVDGWRDAGSTVHLIAYEELHRNFAATIQRIGAIIGVAPPENPPRPGLDAYSSIAWRGVIGSWRDYWSREDETYFEEHAGALMDRLGYVRGEDCSSGSSKV
jgi:hypothetical protein